MKTTQGPKDTIIRVLNTNGEQIATIDGNIITSQRKGLKTYEKKFIKSLLK